MTQVNKNFPKLPTTPSNVMLNLAPKVLTFHLCMNLKLKWKPTVKQAYCFRPVQWLDSAAETNKKQQ